MFSLYQKISEKELLRVNKKMLSNKVKILLLKDYFVPVSNLSNLLI